MPIDLKFSGSVGPMLVDTTIVIENSNSSQLYEFSGFNFMVENVMLDPNNWILKDVKIFKPKDGIIIKEEFNSYNINSIYNYTKINSLFRNFDKEFNKSVRETKLYLYFPLLDEKVEIVKEV